MNQNLDLETRSSQRPDHILVGASLGQTICSLFCHYSSQGDSSPNPTAELATPVTHIISDSDVDPIPDEGDPSITIKDVFLSAMNILDHEPQPDADLAATLKATGSQFLDDLVDWQSDSPLTEKNFHTIWCIISHPNISRALFHIRQWISFDTIPLATCILILRYVMRARPQTPADVDEILRLATPPTLQSSPAITALRSWIDLVYHAPSAEVFARFQDVSESFARIGFVVYVLRIVRATLVLGAGEYPKKMNAKKILYKFASIISRDRNQSNDQPIALAGMLNPACILLGIYLGPGGLPREWIAHIAAIPEPQPPIQDHPVLAQDHDVEVAPSIVFILRSPDHNQGMIITSDASF